MLTNTYLVITQSSLSLTLRKCRSKQKNVLHIFHSKEKEWKKNSDSRPTTIWHIYSILNVAMAKPKSSIVAFSRHHLIFILKVLNILVIVFNTPETRFSEHGCWPLLFTKLSLYSLNQVWIKSKIWKRWPQFIH